MIDSMSSTLLPSKKAYSMFLDRESKVVALKYPFLSSQQVRKKVRDLWNIQKPPATSRMNKNAARRVCESKKPAWKPSKPMVKKFRPTLPIQVKKVGFLTSDTSSRSTSELHFKKKKAGRSDKNPAKPRSVKVNKGTFSYESDSSRSSKPSSILKKHSRPKSNKSVSFSDESIIKFRSPSPPWCQDKPKKSYFQQTYTRTSNTRVAANEITIEKSKLCTWSYRTVLGNNTSTPPAAAAKNDGNSYPRSDNTNDGPLQFSNSQHVKTSRNISAQPEYSLQLQRDVPRPAKSNDGTSSIYTSQIQKYGKAVENLQDQKRTATEKPRNAAGMGELISRNRTSYIEEDSYTYLTKSKTARLADFSKSFPPLGTSKFASDVADFSKSIPPQRSRYLSGNTDTSQQSQNALTRAASYNGSLRSNFPSLNASFEANDFTEIIYSPEVLKSGPAIEKPKLCRTESVENVSGSKRKNTFFNMTNELENACMSPQEEYVFEKIVIDQNHDYIDGRPAIEKSKLSRTESFENASGSKGKNTFLNMTNELENGCMSPQEEYVFEEIVIDQNHDYIDESLLQLPNRSTEPIKSSSSIIGCKLQGHKETSNFRTAEAKAKVAEWLGSGDVTSFAREVSEIVQAATSVSSGRSVYTLCSSASGIRIRTEVTYGTEDDFEHEEVVFQTNLSKVLKECLRSESHDLLDNTRKGMEIPVTENVLNQKTLTENNQRDIISKKGFGVGSKSKNGNVELSLNNEPLMRMEEMSTENKRKSIKRALFVDKGPLIVNNKPALQNTTNNNWLEESKSKNRSSKNKYDKLLERMKTMDTNDKSLTENSSNNKSFMDNNPSNDKTLKRQMSVSTKEKPLTEKSSNDKSLMEKSSNNNKSLTENTTNDNRLEDSKSKNRSNENKYDKLLKRNKTMDTNDKSLTEKSENVKGLLEKTSNDKSLLENNPANNKSSMHGKLKIIKYRDDRKSSKESEKSVVENKSNKNSSYKSETYSKKDHNESLTDLSKDISAREESKSVMENEKAILDNICINRFDKSSNDHPVKKGNDKSLSSFSEGKNKRTISSTAKPSNVSSSISLDDRDVPNESACLKPDEIHLPRNYISSKAENHETNTQKQSKLDKKSSSKSIVTGVEINNDFPSMRAEHDQSMVNNDREKYYYKKSHLPENQSENVKQMKLVPATSSNLKSIDYKTSNSQEIASTTPNLKKSKGTGKSKEKKVTPGEWTSKAAIQERKSQTRKLTLKKKCGVDKAEIKNSVQMKKKAKKYRPLNMYSEPSHPHETASSKNANLGKTESRKQLQKLYSAGDYYEDNSEVNSEEENANCGSKRVCIDPVNDYPEFNESTGMVKEKSLARYSKTVSAETTLPRNGKQIRTEKNFADQEETSKFSERLVQTSEQPKLQISATDRSINKESNASDITKTTFSDALPTEMKRKYTKSNGKTDSKKEESAQGSFIQFLQRITASRTYTRDYNIINENDNISNDSFPEKQNNTKLIKNFRTDDPNENQNFPSNKVTKYSGNRKRKNNTCSDSNKRHAEGNRKCLNANENTNNSSKFPNENDVQICIENPYIKLPEYSPFNPSIQKSGGTEHSPLLTQSNNEEISANVQGDNSLNWSQHSDNYENAFTSKNFGTFSFSSPVFRNLPDFNLTPACTEMDDVEPRTRKNVVKKNVVESATGIKKCAALTKKNMKNHLQSNDKVSLQQPKTVTVMDIIAKMRQASDDLINPGKEDIRTDKTSSGTGSCLQSESDPWETDFHSNKERNFADDDTGEPSEENWKENITPVKGYRGIKKTNKDNFGKRQNHFAHNNKGDDGLASLTRVNKGNTVSLYPRVNTANTDSLYQHVDNYAANEESYSPNLFGNVNSKDKNQKDNNTEKRKQLKVKNNEVELHPTSFSTAMNENRSKSTQKKKKVTLNASKLRNEQQVSKTGRNKLLSPLAEFSVMNWMNSEDSELPFENSRKKEKSSNDSRRDMPFKKGLNLKKKKAENQYIPSSGGFTSFPAERLDLDGEFEKEETSSGTTNSVTKKAFQRNMRCLLSDSEELFQVQPKYNSNRSASKVSTGTGTLCDLF